MTNGTLTLLFTQCHSFGCNP